MRLKLASFVTWLLVLFGCCPSVKCFGLRLGVGLVGNALGLGTGNIASTLVTSLVPPIGLIPGVNNVIEKAPDIIPDNAFCKAGDVLSNAAVGAGIGGVLGSVVPGVGTVIGGAVGLGIGTLFGIGKSASGNSGCDDTDRILSGIGALKNQISGVSSQVSEVDKKVVTGILENRLNHGITQNLIKESATENRVNFAINRNLINEGRKENRINFGITQGLINQGRMENLVNFAKTQNLVNLGRQENQVNFAQTKGLINQGRLENFVNFRKTQGLINAGRRENIVNFAITQNLINKGRQENQVNFAVTRNLINRGRAENIANFKVTRELINVGRQENLVNFGITQDLINKGRWENLLNFKAIQSTIDRFRQDSFAHFSLLSRQSDRNLKAILSGRIEAIENFKTAFQLLDRNFDTVQEGRLENIKNFRVTNELISSIGDRVLRNQAQSLIENRINFANTANLIMLARNETLFTIDKSTVKIIEAIDRSRIEPVLSQLSTFLNFLDAEVNSLRALNPVQIKSKLEGANGLIDTFSKSRTPLMANSLQSLMSEIINLRYAVPKGRDDQTAFLALDLLLQGTRTYVSVIVFLIDAYGFLADYYYSARKFDKYEEQITQLNVQYNDFKQTLAHGIFQEVSNVLEQVKASGFVATAKVDTVADRLRNAKSAFEKLEAVTRNVNARPPPLTSKLRFLASSKAVGPWKSGRRVGYAIQYSQDSTMSRVSLFSSPFTLSVGLSNPVISLPDAPSSVNFRRIFRKFDDEDPELVGIAFGNEPAQFHDIDRDLFNSAGRQNSVLARAEVAQLLSAGANASTVFEGGSTSVHNAAQNGNGETIALLVEFGASIHTATYWGKLPIHLACERGHSSTVEALIRLGANLTITTSNGLTPLHVAALYGQTSVANLLLSHQADPNAVTREKLTPMHLAALSGHILVVKSLLRLQNVDINAKDVNGFTPLHHAVSIQSPEIAKMLCEDTRIDVNIKDNNELASLHYSAILGNAALVKILLGHSKIQAAIRDSAGLTPLHFAATNGHSNVIQAFTRTPAFRHLLNVASGENWTPLHLAVVFGKEAAVTELLFNFNVDRNAKADEGLAPLHLAACMGHVNLVLRLVLTGASIEMETDFQLRPIHYAAWYGRCKALEVVARQADVNAKTNHGLTALHLSSINGHLQCIKNLLGNNKLNIDSTVVNGATALHFAAAVGRVEVIKMLMEAGANVNAQTKDGKTPVDLAIGNNRTTAVEILRQHDAAASNCISIEDINGKDAEGLTKLHLAARAGDLELLRLLTKCGADTSSVTEAGSSILHEACAYGQLEVVNFLVDSGFDVNEARESDIASPLHLAVLSADPTQVIKFLLARGAKINAVDRDGHTPLDLALKRHKPEVAELLRNKGAGRGFCATPELLGRLGQSDGLTALHRAAREGRLRDVKDLIQCGAPLKVLSRSGSSPLHEAARAGHAAVIEALLMAGAKVDERQETLAAETALHVAVTAGQARAAKSLVAKGAQVNAMTTKGRTALDLARQAGHEGVARWLESKGGRSGTCLNLKNLNDLNADGWTQLHVAARLGYLDRTKMLLNCGASPLVFSSIGSLPIHEAAYNGHSSIVKALIDAGTDPNNLKKDGSTPLYLAAAAGHAATVRTLLRNRANTGIYSSIGSLPIHEAAYAGHAAVVLELLNSGQDPNVRKYDTATSLHLAVIKDHPRVVRYLIQRGADVNAKTKQGHTPLDYAVNAGSTASAEVLKAYGGR